MDRKRRARRLAGNGAGPPGYRQRGGTRLDVEERAELRHRYAVQIVVRNVSAEGFMAVCDDPVEIGSEVSLDVAGIGAVPAQVRWQIADRMGGMFLDPISLSQCSWTATRIEAAGREAQASAG